MAAAILEPPKIKSVTVSIVSASICYEVMEVDAMIFTFRMLSFKPAFSLSSFAFIKRLFSSSLLSGIRVVSSPYLRLLVFLPAILIPACASSSPAFRMMYSAYKLNKQGYNIQRHLALAAATGALSMAKQSYPTTEVRGRSQEDPMPEGSGQEELPHVRGEGGGREELPHATSEARGSGQEE